MSSTLRRQLRLSSGTRLSFITAGATSQPAVLLLHGFPSSARTFEAVIPELAQAAYVIAPDLPGFGESEPLQAASFHASADAIAELLQALDVGRRFIYLHDFGAPVGFRIAMRSPESVAGLIVQNANAHPSGLGPQWDATRAFWTQPNAENERAATAHLTREGTRQQYVAGVPQDVAEKISPDRWEEDWRVMCLPGRMDTQRALIADYANYVADFDAIAAYLERWQPPALMLWGRHDAFFDLAETVAWMRALPRMEAHVFDAGHFLLETHAAEAAPIMRKFVFANRARPSPILQS